MSCGVRRAVPCTASLDLVGWATSDGAAHVLSYDQTRAVMTGTLLEVTKRRGPMSGHTRYRVWSQLKCTDDR